MQRPGSETSRFRWCQISIRFAAQHAGSKPKRAAQKQGKKVPEGRQEGAKNLSRGSNGVVGDLRPEHEFRSCLIGARTCSRCGEMLMILRRTLVLASRVHPPWMLLGNGLIKLAAMWEARSCMLLELKPDVLKLAAMREARSWMLEGTRNDLVGNDGGSSIVDASRNRTLFGFQRWGKLDRGCF